MASDKKAFSSFLQSLQDVPAEMLAQKKQQRSEYEALFAERLAEHYVPVSPACVAQHAHNMRLEEDRATDPASKIKFRKLRESHNVNGHPYLPYYHAMKAMEQLAQEVGIPAEDSSARLIQNTVEELCDAVWEERPVMILGQELRTPWADTLIALAESARAEVMSPDYAERRADKDAEPLWANSLDRIKACEGFLQAYRMEVRGLYVPVSQKLLATHIALSTGQRDNAADPMNRAYHQQQIAYDTDSSACPLLKFSQARAAAHALLPADQRQDASSAPMKPDKIDELIKSIATAVWNHDSPDTKIAELGKLLYDPASPNNIAMDADVACALAHHIATTAHSVMRDTYQVWSAQRLHGRKQ